MARRRTSILFPLLAIAAARCGAPPAPVTPTPPAETATPVAAPAPPDPGPSSCPAPAPVTPTVRARQMLQVDHVFGATHVAMSTDGRLATTSQFDGGVRVWDVRRRALLAAFPRAESVYGLGFSGANLAFYSPDIDGTRREIVDLVGHLVAKDKGRFEPIVHGASGDLVGALIVGAEVAFTPPGGAPVKLAKPPGLLMIADAHLSPDGRKLLVRGMGNDIVGWSLDTPTTPPRVARISTHASAVAISPDGETYAFAAAPTDALAGYHLELGSLGAGTTTPLADGSDAIDQSAEIVFSPDGSTLVVADAHGVDAYTVATRKRAWTMRGHQFDPKGASVATGFWRPVFTPDGKLVVAQAQSGPLYVLDATSGRVQGHIGEPLRAPKHLIWADDGTLLAGSHGHVAIWDAREGRVSQAYDVPSQLSFARLASGDLAVVRRETCVLPSESRTNLWVDHWTGIEPPAAFLEGRLPDPRTGCRDKDIAKPRAPTWPPPRGVQPLPLAVPGYGLRVDLARGLAMVPTKPTFFPKDDAVRDLLTGHTVTLAKFTPPQGRADDVQLLGGWVFSPVRTPDRREIGVWNAKTGAHVHDLALPAQGDIDKGGGELVGVSEDGRFAAVGHYGRVAVFALPSGKSVREIAFPRSIVERVGFVDGARDLYVSSRALEGPSLHHVVEGTPTLVGRDPSGGSREIVPSPKGDRVATVGWDGAIRVWSSGAHRLLATLAEFADDEFIAYTPGGAYVGTSEVASRVMWVFDDPLEGFSFEQFAARLDRPEMLRRRLGGDDADVAADLPRPPRVEVESATPAADGRTAVVRLHVTAPGRTDVVRLFVEGREVASRHVCAPDAHVDLTAPLVSGVNRITTIAYDDAGLGSNPAVVEVPGPAAAERPDLWVVSIGVSGYPHLEPRYQLQYAEADARSIAERFGRLGGAGQPFAQVHTTPLLGAEVTPASVARAMEALRGMKDADVAVVFFAGHGVKASESGEMVFLTSLATGKRATLAEESVGWGAIADALGHAKGRALVLLDACHSGHVSRELVVPNDALARSLVKGGRAGAFVFAAAKGRQASFEADTARGLVLDPTPAGKVTARLNKVGHGYFTAAVLDALDTAATDANADGAIQLSELVDAVTDRVKIATSGAQAPWVARREILGDFTVAPTPAR
jgi:WD40 repeat protein/uncharacterized caspase-like protein